MSWQELQNYLAIQDPSSAFSKSVTEDIDGTMLERLEYIANRVGGGVTDPKFMIVPDLNVIVSKAASVAASLASAVFNDATANRALYIPFTLVQAKTLAKIHVFNGGTAAGNLDVGVYSHDGATKHVSMGSTAQSGTNTVQSFDVGDTALSAGNYYVAVAGSTTTATLLCADFDDADQGAFIGCKQQASAFALPSSATFATWVNDKLPIIVLEFTS